jgi:hypothetical protein
MMSASIDYVLQDGTTLCWFPVVPDFRDDRLLSHESTFVVVERFHPLPADETLVTNRTARFPIGPAAAVFWKGYVKRQIKTDRLRCFETHPACARMKS